MVNSQAMDEEGSRFGGLESNRASADETRPPDELLMFMWNSLLLTVVSHPSSFTKS
jgi:hypothetical protein